MNEFHTATAGVLLYRQHGVVYRHLAHRQPSGAACAFLYPGWIPCRQPPWGLVPGCTRTQVARTHISTVSYRREHATARTHTHTPQHPNASAHAHGHISAPRTRSRTRARARARASTRARTRARTEDDLLNNLCRQHVSCRTGSSACACAPRGL